VKDSALINEALAVLDVDGLRTVVQEGKRFLIHDRDPVPTEKSVPVDAVDLAGGHGIRFSTVMSLFLSLLLTFRSCARSCALRSFWSWRSRRRIGRIVGSLQTSKH
jgi:hypothetical protein